MTRSEFMFKDLTNEEIENKTQELKKLEKKAGTYSADKKMYMYAWLDAHEELRRRGEESRGIWLMLKDDMEDTDTSELQELHRIIEDETMNTNGIFKDHFTDCGDPITDAASIIGCFLWFLEVELKKRGIEYR